MPPQTLKLTAVCPQGHASHERCQNCLHQWFRLTPGVQNISVEVNDGDPQAQVVIDFDPSLISHRQLECEAQRVGVCLNPGRAELVLGVEGMVSSRSERAIEAALSSLPSVSATASFPTRTLRIEFDRAQCALPEIAARLDNLGFHLRSTPFEVPPSAAPIGLQQRVLTALRFLAENHKFGLAILGGIFLLGAVLIHTLGGPQSLRYVLVGLSFLVAGYYTVLDAFLVLCALKFDIDVLMLAAAFGAALLGHFEEGAFLLFLFAIGGAGEELAMERARHAIEALAKLAPDTATRRDENGFDKVVPIEELRVNDRVVVKPFDRLPADGIIESGSSPVDQSPITGESVPVDKVPGDDVFAGTINGSGLLIVNVTKPAAGSTLAKIVRMVEEAQTTKSPTQQFTEEVERRYVPFVLISTAALIILPPLLKLIPHTTPDSIWSGWFYQAMAFLTAASPCALAIGTPAAVLSGIARAAKLGVLVKGGAHLENLGKIRVVAFDKTGTLTRGRPQITDILVLDSMIENDVLGLAAAVEQTSTHPLAEAIVHEAQYRGVQVPEATDAQQIPGQGISAFVDGKKVIAGRAEMLNASATPALHDAVRKLSEQGKSVVAVAVDGKPLGVIGLADKPRTNAGQSLARLKRLGIQRNIMLTGDKAQVAENIARFVGADEFHAELMPHDKLDLVSKLQEQYGPIAMVGDGVNDAPALASATVGIAMGSAGTDVAIETADVALMGDDLAKLPEAIGLSRFSRRIIKQNLVIALGTIAVLAPIAALGYAYLGVAVLFHEGSTVVVVLNSLRLLRYRAK